MGDIADMMIDGTLDMYTGEYIGNPCGYPRSIKNKSHKSNKGYKYHKFDFESSEVDKCSICVSLE